MSTTQPIRDYQALQAFKAYYLKSAPHPRNYTLCILGLNTALRISDILNLQWKDVCNFETKTFRKYLNITERKTGKTNRIVLNNASQTALRYLYRNQSHPPLDNDYLFQSTKSLGRPLSRYQAYRIISSAAVKSGMDERISCHSLRKTFGYYAWKQGTPPAMLMNIYNHSSYQITKRYLGIEQDDRDKVFLNINL